MIIIKEALINSATPSWRIFFARTVSTNPPHSPCYASGLSPCSDEKSTPIWRTSFYQRFLYKMRKDSSAWEVCRSKMVRLARVERATLCLGGRCSIHLSYNRVASILSNLCRICKGAAGWFTKEPVERRLLIRPIFDRRMISHEKRPTNAGLFLGTADKFSDSLGNRW